MAMGHCKPTTDSKRWNYPVKGRPLVAQGLATDFAVAFIASSQTKEILHCLGRRLSEKTKHNFFLLLFAFNRHLEIHAVRNLGERRPRIHFGRVHLLEWHVVRPDGRREE